MSQGPAALQGYTALDQDPYAGAGGVPGNVEDEWMQNYFQPQGYAPVMQQRVVDPGLYSSYASDVSEALSTASIAEDVYDPMLIPQGFEAPPMYFHEPQPMFMGGQPQFMHPQFMHEPEIVHQPEMVRYIQRPERSHVTYRTAEIGHAQPQFVQQRVPAMGMQPQQAQMMPAPLQQAQIGISIWQKGSWHVIASVTPGSDAQKKGLATGDVLRKLDRVSLKGWHHEQIMAKLAGEEGSPVVVRTNNKKLKVIRDCQIQGQPTQQIPQPAQQQQFIEQQVPRTTVFRQPMPQPQQRVVIQQEPVQQQVQFVPQQQHVQFVQQEPQVQFVPQQQKVQFVPQQQVQFVPQQQQVQFVPQQQQQVIQRVMHVPVQHQMPVMQQGGPVQMAPGMGMPVGMPAQQVPMPPGGMDL